MPTVRAISMIVLFCMALLGLANAALAQAGVGVGAGVAGRWPGYGPYGPYPHGPYPYGAYAPWGPCMGGFCGDSIELRRAVRREMQLQELRRELEQRAGAGFLPGAANPYGVSRDPPPPTPESEMQPRYRGSGEVRPEYRGAGQAR